MHRFFWAGSESVRRATCLTSLAAVALSASAGLAAVLSPGGTLSPVPGSALPAGTVEYNASSDFDIRFNRPLPQLPVFVRGTIQRTVYRLPDNTLTFRYYITSRPDSEVVMSRFTMTNYADFLTDVTYQTGIFLGSPEIPTTVTRSSVDGTTLNATYSGSLGFINARPILVRTDATSYSLRGSVRVYSSGDNSSLLLSGMPQPVTDSTPPVVTLNTPTAFEGVCNPVAIAGTASDSGGFSSYKLEYSANVNGPWILITESATAVSNGSLGSWATTSVPQGYYFLRLTAENTSGLTNSVTNVIFVDKQFDTVDLRGPQEASLLGGTICFDGTISDGNSSANFQDYAIAYAPLPAGSPFSPVDPATPLYTIPVQNDGLGSWNTLSGPTAVVDGNYRLRITGRDRCGHSRVLTRDISVDNTPPRIRISSPSACDSVQGALVIRGSVADVNLAGWTLQYTGGDANGWVTIASGANAVSNAVLGTWNTSGLRPCAYTLRLLASDRSVINCGSTVNSAEYTVSVKVGCPADLDDGSGSGRSDGGITLDDLLYFIQRYESGC